MNLRIKFVEVIPAHPGFAVLEVLSDDNGRPTEINENPVVAWALEEEFYAPYPITLEGVQTENAAILRPDGKVEHPCSCLFLDAAAWLDEQQREHARKSGVRA